MPKLSMAGIALQMGKIATMGLAAVINGPVQNIVFSLLGAWWGGRRGYGLTIR